MRYCIISDDSGHNFTCPADRRGEADDMLGAYERYWADPEGECPPFPDFIQRIDGPGSITFEDPR